MHKLLWAALLVLSTLGTAVAATADDPYQVRVAVSGQGAAEREQAVQAGLARVLVRSTGRQNAAEDPELAPVLREANRYVQQFSYENTSDGLRLKVQFDSRGLQRTLGERRIAVWQPDRPPALIWLAIDGGGERLLLGANERPALREPVAQAARAVGVPLLFPLLDLEDLAKVRFSDVWGGFSEDLETASERYGTNLIVLARVHRERDGRWRGRWSLLNQRGEANWQTAESDLERSLQAGIHELAQRLAPRYTSVPSLLPGSDNLRVAVQGVRELRDYLRLESYFSGLSGVGAAWLESVEGDVAAFNLAIDGSHERILRALRSDGRLFELASDESGDHRFQLRR